MFVGKKMNNYSDYFEGCGTGIKWTFEGAKYPKGQKLIDDNKREGIITLSYHFGNEESRTYFVKWQDNSETEVDHKTMDRFVKNYQNK